MGTEPNVARSRINLPINLILPNSVTGNESAVLMLMNPQLDGYLITGVSASIVALVVKCKKTVPYDVKAETRPRGIGAR
jgi:hypothetical protein